MKRVSFALTVLLAAGTAWSQAPAPKLAGAYPAGGQAGTSVKVTLRGTDLDEVTALYFDHPGITAVPDLGGKPAATPAPSETKNKRGGAMTPAGPVSSLVWTVAVAADVPVGMHEVCVVGKGGVSNPRVFQISELKEFIEAEPNDQSAQAQAFDLNGVINAQMDKTADVDWFKVRLPAGKRVVIECAAERIDSKMQPVVLVFDAAGKQVANNSGYIGKNALVDFTPAADGEYLLKVFDFIYGGGGTDYWYRLSVSTRPQVEFALPSAVAPGKTADVTLYGRNLPGGVPAPEAVVGGKQLEKLVVKVTAPAAAAGGRTDVGLWLKPAAVAVDGFEYRLKTPAGTSDPILLALSPEPAVTEKEPNNSPETAQAVTLPAEICGLFGALSDKDYFSFEAKKGDVWRIEVSSDRLGSPSDPVVFIGQYMAASKDGTAGVNLLQDNVDDDATVFGVAGGQGPKFDTRSYDPRTVWTVPADGKYFLRIQDLHGDARGDARSVYRLSVRKSEPDFRLAVIHPEDQLTGGLTVRQGGRQGYQVVCARYDNFNETIKIDVTGLPSGVTCAPAYLGPNATQIPLILSAGDNAALWNGAIQVTGTATVNGKPLVRQARGAILLSAGNPNQNQAARICRITRQITLAVRETAPYTVTIEPAEISIVPGGKADVKVKVTRRAGFDDAVALTLFDTASMPNQQQQQPAVLTIPKDKTEMTFSLPAAGGGGGGRRAGAGAMTYGTYTYALLGSGNAPAGGPATKGGGGRRGNAGKIMDPSNAVTIHIAEPMEITIGAVPAKVAAGATVELPVTVKRLPGVNEDITLTLTGIPGKSFTAQPLVLAKGATAGKLVLKGDAKASSQMADGLSVVGSVTVNGSALKVTKAVGAKIEVVAEPPAAPKKK